jgi:hypothetical protein
MDTMSQFPDPDNVAGAEYRFVFDFLGDTLADCPLVEREDMARGVLNELISVAQDMLRALDRPAKEAK